MTQMNDSFVNVLNTKTGKTGRMPRRLFEHPVFNRDGILVEVKPGTKPYNEVLYREQDPETFVKQHPDKVVSHESAESNDDIDIEIED